MSSLVVQGGSPLSGTVSISGAKNAVLPMMAAALLTGQPTTLTNVPRLLDVETMREVLHTLGADTHFAGNRLMINPGDAPLNKIPVELMRRMRASYYVIPALLARRGGARAGMPGGCSIGARKIDLHLKAFAALGAEVRELHDEQMIEVCPGEGGLHGGKMSLLGERGVSVGATCNALMAAVLVHGKTTIEGAAREPEIVCLAEMLTKMGAKISGAGTATISVEGVDKLSGEEFAVIPDRIEAGTYLLAGLITGGEITIINCRPDHMHAVLEKLQDADISLSVDGNSISACRNGATLKPVNIKTAPYPHFPTDLQSPFAALLTQAEGTSVIEETIFENRFSTGLELRDKMGAGVSLDNSEHAMIIQGPAALRPATLEAVNLRCGAALVLAALAANGESEVRDVYHIRRGYERFDEKLKKLGAKIRSTADIPS